MADDALDEEERRQIAANIADRAYLPSVEWYIYNLFFFSFV
jgi:hypothetical protein